jgi:hypothetical protein
MHFSTSLIKLIISFLSNIKFRVSVEGEMSTHKRNTSRGATRFRSIPNLVQFIYINYAPQNPGVHLALFADDTFIYCTDRKEGYVLRKLQRGLTSVASWCERWNIKINEDKTQAIYFPRRHRPVETCLTLNGRNIPSVNQVKYLDVVFDRKITWRFHIEMIDAKAFRTFIRVYSLFQK